MNGNIKDISKDTIDSFYSFSQIHTTVQWVGLINKLETVTNRKTVNTKISHHLND